MRAELCLHSCVKLGIDQQDAITLAAICELLHNASLVQDDLMDRAPTRRNVQSVWVAFGDATAVCAGDLLLSIAFALVGKLRCVERLPQVLAVVYRCTRAVILGQGAEQTCAPVTLKEYELVAIGKSASLLSLPLELPLLISGNSQHLTTAQRAAEDFAAAYQILDDLADYEEDLRNGALNAVSVTLTMGDHDYARACALVRNRAEQLVQSSIEYASALPCDCGSAMIVYANTMRSTLHNYLQAPMNPSEWLRHAG